MPDSTLTISEIKTDILQRVRERQASIERGEYEVALRYAPLPWAELLDLFSQWEYRRDSLGLAVPAAGPGLGARLNRFCKKLVCTSLRWLLMRQVEFNSAALRHAQVLAEFLAVVDRNQAECVAALTSLKLQAHAQAERIARLERGQPSILQDAGKPPEYPQNPEDNLQKYETYLTLLTTREGEAPAESGARDGAEASPPRCRAPVLVAGSGRGDFLRFLISEGIAAQGIEPDLEMVEYCRERELPIVHAEFMHYLDGIEDDSIAGIILEPTCCEVPAGQLGRLLGRCWTKLKQGAVLIAETENPLRSCWQNFPRQRLPVELLHYLFESQCFTVVDTVFSAPMGPEAVKIVRTSAGESFDLKQYRNYAVAGRR